MHEEFGSAELQFGSGVIAGRDADLEIGAPLGVRAPREGTRPTVGGMSWVKTPGRRPALHGSVEPTYVGCYGCRMGARGLQWAGSVELRVGFELVEGFWL